MTIADAFADVIPPQVAEKRPATVLPEARVSAPPDDLPTTAPRVGVSGRVKAASGTVVADLRGSWLWDAHGLTVRGLWQDRMPALDRVPDGNRALWTAWVVYNHAVLAVLVPALFVLYLAGHPARFLLAAVVAAPLLTLWING